MTKTGETTDYAYVYNTADKEYEALQQGMSEGDGQAVLCITIQNAKGADENDLRNVKNILENAPLTFWKLTATTYSYGTSDWTAEMRYPYTQEQRDRAGHSVRDSRECTDNGYIAAGRAFLYRRAAG